MAAVVDVAFAPVEFVPSTVVVGVGLLLGTGDEIGIVNADVGSNKRLANSTRVAMGDDDVDVFGSSNGVDSSSGGFFDVAMLRCLLSIILPLLLIFSKKGVKEVV